MSVTHSPPPKIQWLSLGWLSVGLAVLIITFLLWIWLQIAERKTLQVVEIKSQVSEQRPEPETLIESTLGFFTTQVPVLDLTKTVVVGGVHGPEFRGGAFLRSHAQEWTLQLMKVSQEDTIRNYLSARSDRSQFYYFRLVEGQQEQYVLTYGAFATVQTAMGALRTIAFDLPATIKPMPERFSTYQPLVSDQGSDERLVGAGAKVRQVRLYEVARPIEPVALPNSSATTSAPKDNLEQLIEQKAKEQDKQVQDGFDDEPDAAPQAPATAPQELPPVTDPFN